MGPLYMLLSVTRTLKMTDEAVILSRQVHWNAGNDRMAPFLYPVRSLKTPEMTESALWPMREVHIGASR